MKILSFVIPAYNSSAFIEHCLSSMLVPEVLDALEIVVVNDGSTDNTAEMVQQFCTRFPETVRLISQENKGHGGALNTGCAAAQGKYIKVIDADDWIQSKNLPEFIRLLAECSSDVVLTHYRTINITTNEIKCWRHYPASYNKAYTFREITENWGDFERSLTFHGIAYRRDFYQSWGHILPEHIFYEDQEYATFPCCYGQSITCLDLFLYEYRIGDASQSVSYANQLKRLHHVETVIHRMMQGYATLPETAGKDYAARKLQGVILSYLTTSLLINPDRPQGRRDARNLMAYCQKNASKIYDVTRKKYQCFVLMNYLHFTKCTWDRILNSSWYRWVQKKHTFS